MSQLPPSTRREFLTGKAALDAASQLAASQTEADRSPVQFPRAESESLLLHVTRRAMACNFQVFLNAGQYATETDAAVAVLDLVDRLEDQLTVYRDHSEVSQLNRLAADGPVQVESRLFELLQLAVQLSAETGGAYDITSGPLSKIWGFYKRQGQLPDPAELAAALARVGSNKLHLDPATQSVQFRQPGMEINLGSIGKGYALDRGGERLLDEGIENFLLHGGQSSVVARGSRGTTHSEHGWIIGLKHPLRPERRLAEIRLCNRALATSGSGAQFFLHQGRRYGHILDPRTGQPADGVLSATALAASGALADALSTAFYVMGPQAALQYCQQRGDCAAIVISRAAQGSRLKVQTHGLAPDEFQLLPD